RQGAAACGHVLPEGFAGKLLAATDRMPDYLPSMVHDHRHKRPLELQALYGEPLAAAARAGCELPRVQALHQALAFLDAQNGR
ncbi:MAG TPA: ketopantoate reductase C-terminal domain-containing protein, partial [Pseudomonas sp.]|nr:ketopantoate reductase C-terminal domain-containing protein [Pseudomonas sp.]